MRISKRKPFWDDITYLLFDCSDRTIRIDTSDTIYELTAIEIGGLEQRVLIQGEEQACPVPLRLRDLPVSALRRDFDYFEFSTVII